MKKQILILVLAILAIGFSSTAFGQALTPRTLECIDLTDPLNVVPGQPYTYEVNVPTPPGTKTFHWFITQDINMITNAAVSATIQTVGGPILAAGEAGTYNTPTSTDNSVTLTFQSFTLAAGEYVFLGVLVTNDGATPDCNTNNFKVYRILPLHAFSLDIANVDATGSVIAGYGTDGLATCMAPILTASYNAGANAIAYDFNENEMFYVVAAANFSGDYRLSVLVSDLTSSQTATITWGYTWATVGANALAPAGSGNGTYTADVSAQAASGAVGAAGETIFIRVLIDHGTQFEGNLAANIQYDIAVNGNLLDGTGALIADAADVHHIGTTCAQVPFDDIATQFLVPRPAVTSVTPVPQGYLNIAP
jgi:hypothetical protein